MFRALSTRSHPRRYEKLADEPAGGLLDGIELKRSMMTLSAARVLGSPVSGKSTAMEMIVPAGFPAAKKTRSNSKCHPIINLFNGPQKKKKTATARPEFARYLEYVKEGGLWDVNSNMPVIYYR